MAQTNSLPVLRSKLFPAQQSTIDGIMNTFHGRVGHCSNGKIVCLPFGEGKTLTSVESARLISNYLKSSGGTSGPCLFITQRTIVETIVDTGTRHYDPPLDIRFFTKGDSVDNNPDRQTCYTISSIDVIVMTYDTLASLHADAVSARIAILKEALGSKMITQKEREIVMEFMHSQTKSPDLSTPIPLYHLAAKEIVTTSTPLSTMLFFHTWPVLIMDECHEARTETSDRFKTMIQVNAAFKIGLSATLFNNDIMDVVNAFSLVNIGPPDLASSTSTSTGIDIGDIYTQAGIGGKTHSCAVNAAWKSLFNNDPEAFCVAFTRCRDMYVVQKDTSSTREHYQPVDMIAHVDFFTEQERLYYSAVAEKDDIHQAGKLIRSMAAASSIYHKNDMEDDFENDPHLVVGSSAKKLSVEQPTKVRIVMELLKHPLARNEKSVVFAQYLHTVKQLTNAINAGFNGTVKTFVITADASSSQREQIITACREYRGLAVLISTKILSQGCDLSFANHTFLMNVWWNDVNEKQSRARTERPAQTKSVFSTQIIIKDTVEETIWAVSRCKRILTDRVMEGDITPSIINKITMLSAMTTFPQEYVKKLIAEASDVFVSFPFDNYPPTRAILPLVVAPHARPPPKRQCPSVRSVSPILPIVPRTKRDTFIKGRYKPHNFRSFVEPDIRFKKLISSTPASDSRKRSRIIILDPNNNKDPL